MNLETLRLRAPASLGGRFFTMVWCVVDKVFLLPPGERCHDACSEIPFGKSDVSVNEDTSSCC